MDLQARRFAVRIAFAVACFLAAPVAADASVLVQKAPPAVERRTFDRRNPPPEMPELERRTSAITVMRYGCSASVGGPVVSRRRQGGGYVVTCRVASVEAKLDAAITIWLPRRARQIWVDHEEGHRVIAERTYDVADEIARHEARKLVGRTFTGTGPTASAASADALRRAAQEFIEAYQRSANDWSKRVGDRYDEITDHSEDQSVTVEEAIRQAFEDEPPPPSARAAFARNSNRPRRRVEVSSPSS